MRLFTLPVQLVYSQTIPIAYFFGHQSPGENVKLYKMLVTTLAEQCTRRMAQNRLGARGFLATLTLTLTCFRQRRTAA